MQTLQRFRPLVAAVLLGLCGSAGAVTITMTGAGGSGGHGNTLQFSSGGITVNAYAWGETGALQTSTPSNF